ncbi:MAG TPA: ABC transporter permease [Casimicrobiaceae bacterium]|nr:ABC transporter permease [Casimicrobiaceae bacterium]
MSARGQPKGAPAARRAAEESPSTAPVVTSAQARVAQRRRRGGRWHHALHAWCALVFAFLMAPLLIVFPISLSSSAYLQFPPPGWSWRWYEAYFADATWMDATWRSLEVATCTTLLATVLGTMLAFSLVRGRYPGKAMLNQASLLPLVVPVIVYSIAVYAMFGQLKLIGMWQAIVLGHSVLAIPFVVIVVGAALRTFDVAQEHAAMSLGANRATAIWRITLPQLRPALISAAFLAFISSFDELVVAMFLGGSNMTLPKKMFDNIVNEIDPTIAAVSVVQILLVTLVLLIVSKLGTGAVAR